MKPVSKLCLATLLMCSISPRMVSFFANDSRAINNKSAKLPFHSLEDPMLRSGLALAGANYAWKHGHNPYNEEDGILTAYEISKLNLSNTDLVVLSACETGLGDINGSEGVFGLQRAFKMAGVDYLIMSLWQVSDQQTADLMNLFYEYWLNGNDIRSSFEMAQSEMREKYDPYYWAAFVLVGDVTEVKEASTSFKWQIWLLGSLVTLLLLRHLPPKKINLT